MFPHRRPATYKPATDLTEKGTQHYTTNPSTLIHLITIMFINLQDKIHVSPLIKCHTHLPNNIVLFHNTNHLIIISVYTFTVIDGKLIYYFEIIYIIRK